VSRLVGSEMCIRDSYKADSPKGKCNECGGYHGLPAVHLDYVGHAALTDRLLDADPNWTWEPLGFTPDGLPATDRSGGLWIKLTVCGLSRLGYGHAGTKTGGDAVKEMIGDALRNAAMRFGAALDLWHKGQLHVDDEDDKPEPQRRPAPTQEEPQMVTDASTRKSAPVGFHYVEGYKVNGEWHEARLLRWDDQGGSLKVSTKREQIGAVLADAYRAGVPVKADIMAKKGSVGEAYLNRVTLWKPVQSEPVIDVDASQIPF
jgi:hypothetical protein